VPVAPVALLVPMLLPLLLMPAPPGELVDAPVPGAICPGTAPGEPSERVAAAPGVLPVEVPGETVLPEVPEVALELAGPPGDWPDCIVPGATCDLMSPGEPCDLVASAAPWVVCANAPPAASMTHAENTAVFIIFM
jgi:hypothetical protein